MKIQISIVLWLYDERDTAYAYYLTVPILCAILDAEHPGNVGESL